MTQATSDQKLSISPTTGAIVALGIALPSGLAPVLIFDLLVIVGGGAFLDNLIELSGWLVLCCLAFCGAASVIASLTNRKGINRPARIVLLAMLTNVLGLLLMPVVVAIWSAPTALNGGAMPCLHIDDACQAGLHGFDAVGGLVSAALSWYFVGVPVTLSGVVVSVLVVPAAVWDKLMLARVASATYQRSV